MPQAWLVTQVPADSLELPQLLDLDSNLNRPELAPAGGLNSAPPWQTLPTAKKMLSSPLRKNAFCFEVEPQKVFSCNCLHIFYLIKKNNPICTDEFPRYFPYVFIITKHVFSFKDSLETMKLRNIR
jgi:hypothetical protein